MEALVVSIFKMVLENPSLLVIVEFITLLGVIYLWRFLAKIKTSISELLSIFKAHSVESTARGAQIETIKDSVMELKGIIAGMTIGNRELK